MKLLLLSTDGATNYGRSDPDDGGGGNGGAALHRRSSLVDLSNTASHPALMQIVRSICKDGLGLIGW